MRDNIRNPEDLAEATQLLVGFATLYPTHSHEQLRLDCHNPELTLNICAIAMTQNCNYIDLEKLTRDKLHKYLTCNPEKIELGVDSELQHIVPQCQNLFDLGLVPEISPEAEEILRIRSMSVTQINSNKAAVGYQLNINQINPIIALQQIIYCLKNGIACSIHTDCQRVIQKYLKKQNQLTHAIIHGSNYHDAKANLKIALELGLIPEVKDLETRRIFAAALDYHQGHTQKSELLKITSKNPDIAHEQFYALMEAGIPVKFQKYSLPQNELKTITLDFNTPQATIQATQYACKCGLNIALSEYSRNHLVNHVISSINKIEVHNAYDILHNPHYYGIITPTSHKIEPQVFKAIPEIHLQSPTYQQFKFCMENALRLHLTSKAIKNIAKDIQHIPTADLLINFSNYPPKAYYLLVCQIQQIETINKHLVKPIKFYCIFDATE